MGDKNKAAVLDAWRLADAHARVAEALLYSAWKLHLSEHTPVPVHVLEEAKRLRKDAGAAFARAKRVMTPRAL